MNKNLKILRKLSIFPLKSCSRSLVVLGVFCLFFNFAKAQSIPSGPENFQVQTDWIDQSPNPLTVSHIYRSFGGPDEDADIRSEEHTSELQSQSNLVCRLLLEKKKKKST